jgi:LacI family transcriptional regulator
MAIRGSTLRDVARQAGVSIGTASKAFNNKGSLSPETRRRVLQAADALNFAPNALIRSLQRGASHTVGVLTWDIHEDPTRDITMHLWRGIAEGVAATGRDSLVYSRLPERTRTNLAATFLDGRADGLILGPEVVDRTCLQALAEAAFPTVVLYNRTVPDGIAYVDVDNEAGVAAAVAHLAALGHRRIAFWAPYPTFNYADRAAGYRRGLDESGLPFDPSLCRLNPDQAPTHTHEEYLGVLARDAAFLFALPDRPTALIVGDDAAALAWLPALAARGVRVPEDLSLVGFDDVARAVAPPGLTTVRQPAEAVGRRAAEAVDAILAGGSPADHRVILPVELVVRGTTAPLSSSSPGLHSPRHRHRFVAEGAT